MNEQRACATDTALPIDKDAAIKAALDALFDAQEKLDEVRRFTNLVYFAADGTDMKSTALASGCAMIMRTLEEGQQMVTRAEANLRPADMAIMRMGAALKGGAQ